MTASRDYELAEPLSDLHQAKRLVEAMAAVLNAFNDGYERADIPDDVAYGLGAMHGELTRVLGRVLGGVCMIKPQGVDDAP